MTREEAIQFLDNMKHEEAGRAIGKDGFYAELMGYHVQALNIAIKALRQEPKTGYWILDADREHGRCSECGCKEDLVDGHSSYKWCSNCGAKMVEPQERSDKG